MATIPTTTTKAVGNKITAADYNTYTRDPNVFWLSVPRVSVTNSAGLSHTTAVWLLETWDTETYDTDTMHSTASNTSRLVATTTGLYSVSARLSFANNATGYRGVDIRKNAAGSQVGGTRVAYETRQALTGDVTVVSANFDAQMTAGDYLEMFGFQNSGGALSSSTGAGLSFFQMRWVASS